MSDIMTEDVVHRLRPAVARGRIDIERRLYPLRWHHRRFWRWTLEALGALAFGILSAGIAIFLTAVVLNLLFHFAP